MANEVIENKEEKPEEMGFYFHAATFTTGIGHPQLEINVYSEPTLKHFDPEEVKLWVVEAVTGNTVLTKIKHPYNGPRRLSLGVGRVIIQDRKHKTVEAFVFGGDMFLTDRGDYTHTVIVSSAPIMRLIDRNAIETIVTSEFEALLAQGHATWKGNDAGFYDKLTQIEPKMLLAAGLIAIQEHLSKMPTTDSHRRVKHAVSQIRTTLENAKQWPSVVSTLDDLLKH
jgi:hypothetical protein